MNILNPAAYVKKIKHEQTSIAKNIIVKNYSNFDSKKFALTRCPNVKRGRRIFISENENGDVVASTVSPLNKNFRSQIEDGIWEIISSLLKKNYFTISSCEGHFFEGPLQFIIAVPNLEFANKIKNLFLSIPFLEVKIKETISNVKIDRNDPNAIKYTKKYLKNYDFKAEAEDINNMYYRTHNRYWFVYVNLFKKGNFWILFYWIFKIFLEKNYKNKLLSLIDSDRFPVSPF
jgi:hypothetical protein